MPRPISAKKPMMADAIASVFVRVVHLSTHLLCPANGLAGFYRAVNKSHARDSCA
jgi:hypothetical protein